MNHFRPDEIDCKYNHANNDYEETSFITPGAELALADEASGTKCLCQKSAVYSYYDAMTKHEYTPALGRDYSKFELGGWLQLKAHMDLEIINSRNGEPSLVVCGIFSNPF